MIIRVETLADSEARQTLVSRLSTLRQDSPRLWGKMMPHQAICHMSDSFRACLGEKAISPATGLLQRTVVKWVALYAPMRWPKGVPTRPEVEQGKGGTPPSAFERDLNELAGLIEEFPRSAGKLSQSAHPIFAKLSYAEWMRWGYRHVDHHLRQFGR